MKLQNAFENYTIFIKQNPIWGKKPYLESAGLHGFSER